MNPGSRDTPTEENTQRITSGDGHSKTGGSIVMHDHGRHSPASAHSPGVSGKLPGLHPDSSRSGRGFGTPSFTTTGLPGFNLEHHLPFLLNSAPSLFFPPLLHPSASSLFPPVLPPNFLPPPLQPPLTSLFPSPNAECEASSSGWSAHSGGSRNTSSLGSSSSEGDMAAKVDSRTVRSSRCSPDVNLQSASLSSSVRKIWENTVVDPVCISDADMPLSLVTRRETTSRGSSVAESGVCTGDSVARAASTETSRTPSLDGESGCHPVSENTAAQEHSAPTVTADQLTQWPATKVTPETLQSADDGKSSTSDDMWSSSTAASRSSGIALPPRKRLTRNAEELSSTAVAEQPGASSVATGSPSSAPNFRSCWKKFAAKSNVSGPTPHRAFSGKPQYDCRTYFQKLAEQARAAAASKAFVPGKGKGHCYRNANKASPRSSDQNTGSPRVTRSQSKPKKTQSPKSSPAEPPAPVRKSTRKKSINTRFEEYDRTVGKNKKSKALPLDSNAAVADAGKESLQATGDEGTPDTEKNSQRKNRRRGKQVKGDSSTDGDIASSVCTDGEDSTSQLQFPSDVPQLVSEPDSKVSCTASSAFAATHEGIEMTAKIEDSVEPKTSTVITVLPPKFRHFKIKTAVAAFDTSQPQTNSDQLVPTPNEAGASEVAEAVVGDKTESVSTNMQTEGAATEDGECTTEPSVLTSTENSIQTEISVGTSTEESKVSQSHSVGGRKSLLYRSGATTDSQPTTEANLAMTSSQTECSVSVTVNAVGDLSVNQTSAHEKDDDIKSVLLEEAPALEHSEVLVEESDAMSDSTEPDVSALMSEKAEEDDGDVGVNEHIETLSGNSPKTDMDLSTVSSAVSNTTSDYPSADTVDESVSAAELDSSTASVDNVPQRLDSCHEVLADHLSTCDSHGKLEMDEGSGDISVNSNSQLVESQPMSTDLASNTASSLPVAVVAEASDLPCRTKPFDVSDSSVEEAVSQNSESLKRSLPEEGTVNDDSKRCRVDSIDHTTDRLSADTVAQPPNSTVNTNTAFSVILSSGERDYQTYVPNNKSYTGEKLQASLSEGIQNSSKPERSKFHRSKGAKTNRRLKPSRNRRTVKNFAVSETQFVEESKDSTAESFPVESESDRNNENYHQPPVENFSDGTCETQLVSAKPIVKYCVANSIDKMCDVNSDVSLTHRNSEQKTLRISLVALNESNTPALRVKDTKTESVCNSTKMSSNSSAVTVNSASTAVKSLEHLPSGGSAADAEQPVASAVCNTTQDSAALEYDSSALLSQCKSLSVVIEKMRNNNSSTPPPDLVVKPTSRRRRGGPMFHGVGPASKPEVSADDSLLTSEKPTPEPLASLPVDDEYRFPDDALSESLPPKRLSRPERRTSSRKAKTLLPTPDQVERSPAAASDTSSHGAASSVDSSLASANSGIKSLTPNAVQKVQSKPESASVRSRRRRQNLPEDEDTRSLSPFTPNGSSPAPVVEASLDGHKLKLRITKSIGGSVEASICDTKISAPPPSSLELTDNTTKLKEVEVPTTDHELSPPSDVTPKPVTPRRRQLKVEGVRSRFLTLHKPSVMMPSADHVKCRLVKVGRRHWMSVGGEEADEDSSLAEQHSDAETPVKTSPVAPAVDEMAQHPTRDRLLLVNERQKQYSGRRGRPPKAKPVLADTNSSKISAKRTKKRVKADINQSEVIPSKPEPLPEVVPRPVREDPVPWLDCETDGSEMQPYCALGDSSSRTIAADINEYRLHVSTPVELSSDVDLVISNAFSDCGMEFVYSTLLKPRSMYFVPSELERLMEALVLDDLHRPPHTQTPTATVVASETHILSSGISRPFLHTNNVTSSVFSPRNISELDLLLSQPSLRLRNCTLPVDANDSSDYDCTVVGYEYPTRCYPDSSELPSLLDHHFVDEDYSLPSACLTDAQLYSCVDLVL